MSNKRDAAAISVLESNGTFDVTFLNLSLDQVRILRCILQMDEVHEVDADEDWGIDCDPGEKEELLALADELERAYQ